MTCFLDSLGVLPLITLYFFMKCSKNIVKYPRWSSPHFSLWKPSPAAVAILRKAVPSRFVPSQSAHSASESPSRHVEEHLIPEEKVHVHKQGMKDRVKMSGASERLWEGQLLASIMIFWHFTA